MFQRKRPPRLILGPGLLLAATSIGGSHLLMASRAGAELGYGLLWVVFLAHLLKYPSFEAGPRFALATGESLLAGYKRVPGPARGPLRHWALRLGIADMTLEAAGVIAAVVALCGALAAEALPFLGLQAWALVILAAALALLWSGGYRYLRRINLLLMALLLAGTLAAFAAARVQPAALLQALRPELPPGSAPQAAALLGWMPTALGVAVWHSVWCLRDRRFQSPAQSPARRLALALLDARLGYLLSLVIALCFLFLGARLLYPTILPSDGRALAAELTRLYTERLGQWMRPVFLTLAACAMFSTAYASMDGFPRTFLAALDALRGPASDGAQRPSAQRRPAYWIYLLAVTTAGALLLLLLPSPKILFTALAALTFLLSPLYAFLNHYCVTRLIPDPRHRPHPWQCLYSLLAALALTVAAGLFALLLLRGWL